MTNSNPQLLSAVEAALRWCKAWFVVGRTLAFLQRRRLRGVPWIIAFEALHDGTADNRLHQLKGVLIVSNVLDHFRRVKSCQQRCCVTRVVSQRASSYCSLKCSTVPMRSRVWSRHARFGLRSILHIVPMVIKKACAVGCTGLPFIRNKLPALHPDCEVAKFRWRGYICGYIFFKNYFISSLLESCGTTRISHSHHVSTIPKTSQRPYGSPRNEPFVFFCGTLQPIAGLVTFVGTSFPVRRSQFAGTSKRHEGKQKTATCRG